MVRADTPPRPATYRDVLGVAEFRVLWLANLQSRFGDQLARVAVAVLVFNDTSSALLTALAYALTLVPPLLSAPLLSGIADRHPRRTVLVLTDTCRAGLIALTAIPTMPIPVIIGLLTVSVSLQPLYSGARYAMLPNVLSGDRYIVATGLSGVTDSAAQLIGFGFGGVLVDLVGPHWVLAGNAVTFALSATLVRLGTGPHLPDTPAGPDWSAKPSRLGGLRYLWQDRRLRSLAALLMLYGIFVVPEGIAAPYADELGSGTASIGFLMAADPVGAAIGFIVLTRLIRPDIRERLLSPLAIGSGLPLVASAFVPSLPAVITLWTVAGLISSYTVVAHPTLVRLLPDDRRAQAIGALSAILQASMGLGILFGGVVAEQVSPSLTVAIFGAVGSLCAIGAGTAWHRARTGAPVRDPGSLLAGQSTPARNELGERRKEANNARP